MYNGATGAWSTAQLSAARYCLAAASVGNVAVFGGGFMVGGYTAAVDLYDISTGAWSTALLSVWRYNLAATSVGSLAIFAGGRTSGEWFSYMLKEGCCSRVDGFVCVEHLRARRYSGTGCRATTFSRMCPTADPTNVVDLFNSATWAWTTAQLSEARSYLAATSVGSLAIFAGGIESGELFSPMLTESQRVRVDGRICVEHLRVWCYRCSGCLTPTLCLTHPIADGNSNAVDLYNSVTFACAALKWLRGCRITAF